MLVPFWSEVRYTRLGEKPWSNRRTWVSMLKYAGLVLSAALVVLTALHIPGVKRIPLPHKEPEAEPLLGDLRGPDISISQIPENFKTVGIVFFGRRSRVEILDCYLKVGNNEVQTLCMGNKLRISFSAISKRMVGYLTRSCSSSRPPMAMTSHT